MSCSLKRPLSSRQTKKQKYSVVFIPPCCTARRNFSCSRSSGVVEFHGCHAEKPFLVTARIVKIKILSNCSGQFFGGCEFVQIIHLGFEQSPETFHRSVVYASTDARHTLPHMCFLQFGVEDFTCILKTSVAVKQRVCIRISGNRIIKSIKYKLVIVAFPDSVRNNPSVIQIENST